MATPPQGPSANDLSAQATAMQQMVAATQALAAAFGQIAGPAGNAATAGNQVRASMDAAQAALQGADRSAEKFRENLQKSIDSIESFSDAAGVMKTILKNMGAEGKKAAAALAAVGAGLKGMSSGFKLSMNLAKSFLSGVTSMIGAIFDLSAAILSIPFKLWEGLIGMAKGGGGGGGGLLEAINKIREVFGDPKQGIGKEIIDTARGLAGWGDMAPGLFKVSRQFGTLKDTIEYVMKLAGPAPVLFSSLKDQFEKTGKNVFIMAKGLGIGEEEFQGLMSASKATGESMESIEINMTKFAKGLSSEFGLNSKLMSRDMSRAMKDVKHFANSSVKEIAKATAYAHSLGLELKDITGILDAFNTFDQAAENVSKLSQAFGVNIDVMKLVEAKTPDDALKMLKDSFASAGKSVENMNRHELQLIASTVSMSEEAVRQGLSSKNQAISMNRLAASTDHLAKKTMTASEATTALKKDIEHVIQGGGGGGPESNSLLGMFFEGFMQGITTSKSFMQILKNLRMAFVVVMEKGRELGRAFVEMFPGVKKLFEGLADILSPGKIGGLFESYKQTFIKFFKDISLGQGTVKGLMEALQKNFMDYLTKSGPGGQKVLQGLQEFWKAAKLVIASAIEYLGDMLRDGFNMLIDLIDGKYNSKVSGALGKVGEEVSPITSAFSGLFEKVKGPLGKLFDKFMSWASEKLGNAFKEHYGKIMLYMIGPSLVSGLGSGLMSYATTRLVQGPIAKQLSNIAGTLEQRLPQAGAGGPAAGLGNQLTQVEGGLGPPAQSFAKTFSQGFASSVGPALANVGEFAAKAYIMFQATAKILDYIKEKNFTKEQMEAARVIIDALIDFFVKSQLVSGITSLMGRFGKVSTGGIGQVLAGLMPIGLVVGAMCLLASDIIEDATRIKNPKALKGVAAVVDAVGTLFIKSIPVIGSAMVVGMGLLAGGGIGSLITGGSIIAGMAAISLAAGEMILIAKDLITHTANMPGSGNEIKSKAEAMASIIQALASLLTSVSDVLKSLPMNMFSDTKKVESTFNSAKDFIDILLGRSGGLGPAVSGSTGIAGIIDGLKTLASLPAVNIEAAAKIAPVISAIASTIGAISQAISSLKSKAEAKSSLLGLIDHSGSIEGFGNSLKEAAPIIQNLMTGANTIVTTITRSFSGKDARAAASLGKMGEGLGQIMNGVAATLSALTGPVQHFRKKTKTDIKHTIGPTDVQTLEEFDAKAFENFSLKLGELAPKLGDSMAKLMGGVSSAAIDAAKGITPEKMQGVKAVIDIIAAASQLIGSLTTGAQGVNISVKPSLEDKSVNIKNSEAAVKNTVDFSGMINNVILPDISKVIETLANPATGLPAMLERVMGIIKKNPLNASDIQTAKAMSEIFKVISELMKAVNELMPTMHATMGYVVGVSEQGEKEGGKKYFHIDNPNVLADNIKKSFDVMAVLLEKITEPGDGINSTLVRISLAADLLPSFKKGTIEKVAALKDLMTGFKDMKSAMDDAFYTMTTADERQGLGAKALAEQRAAPSGQSVMPDALDEFEAAAGQPQSSTAVSDQATMAQKFETMAKKMDAITGGTKGGKDSPLGKLSEAIAAMNTTLPADKIAAIGTAKANLIKFNEVTEGFDQQLSILSERTISDVAVAVKTNVAALATALQQFNAGLPAGVGADAQAINVKLGSIANGIGVKDASYAIARGPINFEFKINVQVSGKEMSEAVSAPGTVIFQAFHTAGNAGGNWTTNANPLSVTKTQG